MIRDNGRTRILVAGIGNIFRGDDGFGVHVARRLLERQWPQDVQVTDFGIRGYDLAYSLTSGVRGALLIDSVARGGEPGDLSVIEPDLRAVTAAGPATLDGHDTSVEAVLRYGLLCGPLPSQVLVLACQPNDVGPDSQGEAELSPEVQVAVERAAEMVPGLVAELNGATSKTQIDTRAS